MSTTQRLRFFTPSYWKGVCRVMVVQPEALKLTLPSNTLKSLPMVSQSVVELKAVLLVGLK